MPTLNRTLLVIALLTLVAPPVLAVSAAGKVVYAFGQVQATAGDGSVRPLTRGDAIVPGDTVTTRNGRTQLRFTDGGFAALQPNTEYKVEAYNFDGGADGSERSFMSLVRGSVRLVTGLIGRSNKQNFRLNTPVATIGIRGTSGKISHCDSNCGDRGPGTRLAGYGGIWDLASGSYSGPVKPGEAKFCNGASCFDIPGFGQRSEVDPDEQSDLERSLDDNDENLAEGGNEQFYSDGNDFAVNGGASTPVVATGIVGARAGGDGYGTARGDSSSGDAVLILVDGVPVAEIGAGDGANGGVEFIVTDVKAFLTALQGLNNAELRTEIDALFGNVAQADIDRLAADPASPATIDFGRTRDGRLVHGRWQDGFMLVLDLEAIGINGDFRFDVLELRGNRSEHFIFGPDPGAMPLTGEAFYDFTGGTLSTAVDGSSIGQGVTAGRLTVDFLASRGAIDMTVRHGGTSYKVGGDLLLSFDRRFFHDVSVTAKDLAGAVYAAGIDGFFASRGTQAPLAAGLAYTIETPTHIVGVAGFGLGGVRASTPGLPQGAWVGFAHNFVGGGLQLQSEAFDFLLDASNTATLTNGVVTAFNSTFHDACAGLTPCAFNRNGAGVLLDPTGAGGATALPDVGIRWARFSPGYTVQHSGLAGGENLNGSAIVVAVDVPTAVNDIPATGSGLEGVYNVVIGGTHPVVSFDHNGVQQPEVVSTISSAEIYVNFDSGSVNANFAGSFPTPLGTATWSLNGGAAFNRADGLHSTGVSGSVNGAGISGPGGTPDCGSPCGLFGHTHFVLGAINAGVTAGVLQAVTGGPGMNLAWGYVLRDPDGPGPVILP
ncbi:MAG: FecR domain-containing protein [Gammaproteobacteria bacterium]